MRKYITECVGTFAVVFFGTGAIIVNEITFGTVSNVGIALVFGLIVMAMIHAFGKISGAHLNPAVTIAFAVNKNLPWKEVLPYNIAQFAGALLASSSLKLLFSTSAVLGATLPSGSILQSFILEIILAFFLMLVILQVAKGAKEKGMFAGLTIGSIILLEAIFAGPISGASMNPARSLAPAIVSGYLQHLWIYLTAPFIGSLLAVIFNRMLK